VTAAVNPLPQSVDTEYAAEHDDAAACAAGGTATATERPSRPTATAAATTTAFSDLLRGGLMKHAPPWIGYVAKSAFPGCSAR
jgi:hypothetical protein